MRASAVSHVMSHLNMCGRVEGQHWRNKLNGCLLFILLLGWTLSCVHIQTACLRLHSEPNAEPDEACSHTLPSASLFKHTHNHNLSLTKTLSWQDEDYFRFQINDLMLLYHPLFLFFLSSILFISFGAYLLIFLSRWSLLSCHNCRSSNVHFFIFSSSRTSRPCWLKSWDSKLTVELGNIPMRLFQCSKKVPKSHTWLYLLKVKISY